MSAVHAQTPSGTRWRVRVRWQPRWRPLYRRYGGWRRARNPFSGVELPDVSGGPDYEPLVRRPELVDQPRSSSFGDSKLLLALVIVLLVLGGAVVWWVLLPLVLLVVDGLVLAALVVVGVPLRLLRGGRWSVEATAPVPQHPEQTMYVAVQVPGLRAARRKRDEIAMNLSEGTPLRSLGKVRVRG
jgi:hypothetical protein